jgi:hypothetical protein
MALAVVRVQILDLKHELQYRDTPPAPPGFRECGREHRWR